MVDGKTIAKNGYQMETIVTDWINGFTANSGPYPLCQKHGHQIYSEIKTHVEVNYGHIDEAVRVGNRINKSVVELTRQQSPADIVLSIEDYGWLGVSLKYALTRNSKSRIKVHAPTPQSLARQLDRAYRAVYGQDGKLERLVDLQTESKMEEASYYISTEYKMLLDIFGEPVTDKLTKDHLSHLRKIIKGEIEYKDRDAVNAFYKLLRQSSSNNNRTLSHEIFNTTTSLLADMHSDHRSDLLRYFTNTPQTQLRTILVDARPTNDDWCRVSIYNLADDVERYIESAQGEYTLNKRYGTCTFRFGPLIVEVNTRAGSKNAGAVNITIDKKILTDVRLQDLFERGDKEDETATNLGGQT